MGPVEGRPAGPTPILAGATLWLLYPSQSLHSAPMSLQTSNSSAGHKGRKPTLMERNEYLELISLLLCHLPFPRGNS